MHEEPSQLEVALYDRYATLGWGQVGPLTKDQADAEQAYEQYIAEAEAEHAAQMAAGGRTVCPNCGQRAVKDHSVCTLGYPGHPGAEYSALYECENCDYKELAG